MQELKKCTSALELLFQSFKKIFRSFLLQCQIETCS